MHVLNEIVAKDSRSNRRAADERLMTISLLHTVRVLNHREAGGRHRVDMYDVAAVDMPRVDLGLSRAEVLLG